MKRVPEAHGWGQNGGPALRAWAREPEQVSPPFSTFLRLILGKEASDLWDPSSELEDERRDHLECSA